MQRGKRGNAEEARQRGARQRQCREAGQKDKAEKQGREARQRARQRDKAERQGRETRQRDKAERGKAGQRGRAERQGRAESLELDQLRHAHGRMERWALSKNQIRFQNGFLGSIPRTFLCCLFSVLCSLYCVLYPLFSPVLLQTQTPGVDYWKPGVEHGWDAELFLSLPFDPPENVDLFRT
jgi:hypothetical protein